MGDNQLIFLALAAFIGLVMLFAQLKLFSINTRLGEILQQLRLLTNETVEMRRDLKKDLPASKG